LTLENSKRIIIMVQLSTKKLMKIILTACKNLHPKISKLSKLRKDSILLKKVQAKILKST
jgi:hypothetical protein